MNASPEFIRALIRSGAVNWGLSVQKKPGSRRSYKIIESKFLEYAGIRKEVTTNEN